MEKLAFALQKKRGSIVNQTGGVFNDSATSTINVVFGGTASFTNSGLYSKTSGVSARHAYQCCAARW